MTTTERIERILAIESYLANMFGQILDDRIVKTELSLNNPGQLLVGKRAFSVNDLRIHVRNHTAWADETSPYVLTYTLDQKTMRVFSRAPDNSEWK